VYKNVCIRFFLHVQVSVDVRLTHTYGYQRHGSRIQSEVVGSRVTLIKKSWRYLD
jgi:hypothetical protein